MRNKSKILIIDDDRSVVTIVKYHLEKEGYKVISAGNGEVGLEKTRNERPDLIFQDCRLPGIGGTDLLIKIREIDPHIPVILVTAFGGVKLAVEAIKKGAYDFLSKPIDHDELKITVKNALHAQNLQFEIDSLQNRLDDKYEFKNIIGESPRLKQLLKQVKMVAPTQMTVLIHGESGTGKELFANLIHQKSSRKNQPFIAIDCGAIPDTLVESELFGYEKGAFTGADRGKKGEFEAADKGTLFLDEISNLPSAAQAKLLRVIQERKLKRIGSRQAVAIDVRIIAASNVDLNKAIEKGEFRKDLFHRLNEFFLYLPVLNDRREDIPILVEYFRQQANSELNKNVTGFSPEAIKKAISHHWTGNVRELKNAVRRAVLLSEDSIIPAENIIMDDYHEAPPELDFKTELEAGRPTKEIVESVSKKVEKDIIAHILRETGGNKTKAAARLQMTRMTLYSKMDEYGLER